MRLKPNRGGCRLERKRSPAGGWAIHAKRMRSEIRLRSLAAAFALAGCGGDPVADEACAWALHTDAVLTSTGAAEGDVVANVALTDQCGVRRALHHFSGAYHVLFMSAAW